MPFFSICLLVLGSVIYVFSGMIRKCSEGAAKGSLGAIRSALSIFYEDAKDYPSDLSALTRNGKYLQAIPTARTPGYHPDSSALSYGKSSDDQGGWMYDNLKGDSNFGGIWVNCTHTDSRGTVWSSY